MPNPKITNKHDHLLILFWETTWQCVPQRYFNTDGRRPSECCLPLFSIFCTFVFDCQYWIFCLPLSTSQRADSSTNQKPAESLADPPCRGFQETPTLEKNYVFPPQSFNHLFLSAERWDHSKSKEAGKKRPDLVSKITRAGSASLLLNGWNADGRIPREERRRAVVHAAETQMHVRFALSRDKTRLYVSAGRSVFSFLLSNESSERKLCCKTVAEWTFYAEGPSS